MMRLHELLAQGDGSEVRVSGLCDHAAAVRPGDVFFALAGGRRHGLEFAREAQRRGAVAVVYDPAGGGPPQNLAITALALPGLRGRLGGIASRFYGHPSRELEVIGITGTNGKTSCSFFLAQILGGAVMGTLGWGCWPRLEASDHTTAPALETQRRLACLRTLGVGAVAMEVSSHALRQGRVQGVEFDLALWTNLSRDHLDYHRTLEDYAAAKGRLFTYPSLRAAVLNLDDPAWRGFRERTRAPLFGYTRGAVEVDFPCVQARQIRYHASGIEFTACFGGGREAVRMNLMGEANLANGLAVLATLIARGLSLGEAAAALARLRPVPGRMERFQVSGRPLAVVDYAHTPAALEMALRSLRRHCRGRLWVVFGCGGERDRGKRPQMGAVAARFADRVILTDDNPRGEDAARILQDIRRGMKHPPLCLRDRAAAITAALEAAAADDIVLVAGKGHETYQEIGGQRRPFSDRAVVSSLLGEVSACA